MKLIDPIDCAGMRGARRQALEEHKSMLKVLAPRSADVKEDAAYARGVRAALAILYDSNVRNDSNSRAFEACEKIARDREAEIRASRKASHSNGD